MTTSGISSRTAVRRSGDRLAVDPASLPVHGVFVGGQFRQSASADVLEVVDPCSEELVASIPAGAPADVDAAVLAAREASRDWATWVPRRRSEILHRVADRISEHADLFAALESVNTGKPPSVARDDVESTVDTFRFMAGAMRAPTSQAAGTYAEDHLSVVLREPLGVVGVVTPWNYPLLMAAWKIAPILAAGNTVVVKPSEQTPLTTLKLAEVLADVLPPGVLNVVCGHGPVVGSRLAEHPDIDMIALTGSVRSGRSVARAAAESLKRVHLELGGKAPVVIMADADLAAAAAGVRNAAFWNSGQECGAGCRVLVHESVADGFVALLTEQVSTLVVGEPGAGEDVEVGPMISRAHYRRVLGYLERAAGEGIEATVGGGALDGIGFFVEPTVLVDVPEGAECAREEIFGPVVTVETFTDEAEAVRRANDGPYGLSASVWTDDARLSHRIASRIDCGTVWVNCHLVLATEVPWGGFKGSGYGRDLSLYALDDYSRTKHVMHSLTR